MISVIGQGRPLVALSFAYPVLVERAFPRSTILIDAMVGA